MADLAASIKSALTTGSSPEEIVKAALTAVDSELLLRAQQEPKPECVKGCNFCCRRMPFATAAECLLAYREIRKWEPDALAALHLRLQAYEVKAASHRSEQLARFWEPCPLLGDQGECTIYEHRPTRCRCAVSDDRFSCETLWQRPDLKSRTFNIHSEFQVAQEFELGLASNLGRDWGLRLELPDMLLRLLEDPSAEAQLRANPASFWRSAPMPYFVKLGPPQQPSLGPEVAQFLNGRSSQPLMPLFNGLPNEGAAQSLCRLDFPRFLETAEEGEEWLSINEQALPAAEEACRAEPVEAYRFLQHLTMPMSAYAAVDMRPIQEARGRLFCEIGKAVAPQLCEPPSKRKPGKLRIGFLGRFGYHSGTSWLLGWLKHLDRSEFETHVLAVGQLDAFTYRFADNAAQFRFLAGDALEGAQFVRGLDLDYLFYPDIGDQGGMFQYAPFRLARRQGAGWGIPLTTGLPSIDDYITGHLLEPEDAQDHYSENLVLLPGTGLCLDPIPNLVRRGIDETLGLPTGHRVLFPQYVRKWHPSYDHLLAEIQERVKTPILVSAMGPEMAREAFQRRMDRQGTRVQWIRNLSLPQLQSLMHASDAVLDAPSWSGGLTVHHALAAGAATVHLPGRYARMRLAGGSLKAAGAAGQIAEDSNDYVDLASDRDRLREARIKDPSAMYLDLRPVKALEAHLKAVCPT